MEGGRKELRGKMGVGMQPCSGPAEVQNAKLLRRASKGKQDEGMQHQSVTRSKDCFSFAPQFYFLISSAHIVIFCADLYIRGRRGWWRGQRKQLTTALPLQPQEGES